MADADASDSMEVSRFSKNLFLLSCLQRNSALRLRLWFIGVCKLSPQRTSAGSKCTQKRKTKLKVEQVGKGGLPPPVPHLIDRGTAGVNHPSRLVQFNSLFFLLS